MVNIKTFISLLFVFCIVNAFSQEKKQIELRQAELSGLKKEITELETELKSKTRKEKDSYNTLENYSRQNYLLNKIINNLRTEEKQKEQEINRSIKEIEALEKEIKALKDNYTRYVVAIYKNGKSSELASLFGSKSFGQAILRYKYLQKFSVSRKKDLEELKTNKDRLIDSKVKLEIEKKQKEVLAEQKRMEEEGLRLKLNESKTVLKKIKNDKLALTKEINAKRSAETKIKNLITKLIEEADRKRREEEERLARLEKEKLEKNKKIPVEKKTSTVHVKNPDHKISNDYDLNLSTAGLASFSSLKGRLNWPVTGGKIIKKFGENRNVKLNTITLNYGVDILATSDLNVKSVADGVISAIDWIPGYGSIIIITHKDDYRTVYSHLSEIFVKEGDRIKLGNLIANVGESLEGNILHFEIWSSRNNQNPETWLARR